MAATLAGCAFEHYEPRSLDAVSTQQAWESAAVDLNDPALRAALEQAGVETATWPMATWDLPALTVLALRRHPDLAVARAEAREALARRDAATRRGDPGVEWAAEHHSARGTVDSPWSLGIALDIPLDGGDRRSAWRAEADALADEALLRAALAAWQVRQHVRDAWNELALAERRQRLANEVVVVRAQALQLADRRLAVGAIDARERDAARQHEAEAARDQAASQAGVSKARQALARSLALPLATLEAMSLAEPTDDAAPPAQADALALQRQMLLDRIDLRAQLAHYAAADAALRLEIARQWPEMSLKPGFMWDQGDIRWSLGLGFVLPLIEHNRGPIAQAKSRRDVEAERFNALQTEALSGLDAARLSADWAARQWALAENQLRAKSSAEALAVRRLEAGDADRGDLLGAREEVLQAQRALIDARGEWVASQAHLEDVVQHPLDGKATHMPPIRIGQRGS